MTRSRTALFRRSTASPGVLSWRGDQGANVIEAAAAMIIAVIILLGLAATMASGLRHLHENRLQEQATQLAIDRLEYARSLSYAQVGVDPAVPDTDSRLVSGSRFLHGNAFGLPGDEELVEKDHGNPDAAVPYLHSATIQEVTFTTQSYVSSIQPGLRRVIVCITWDAGQGTREVVMSTTISEVSAP